MSDDRLFVSNNAIGRKFYYINIIILIVIWAALKYAAENVVVKFIANPAYVPIVNVFLAFCYFILAITFFSLLDRRLYDVFGSRDVGGYKAIESLFTLTVVVLIVLFLKSKGVFTLPESFVFLEKFSAFLSFLSISAIFVIGLFRGKISLS